MRKCGRAGTAELTGNYAGPGRHGRSGRVPTEIAVHGRGLEAAHLPFPLLYKILQATVS